MAYTSYRKQYTFGQGIIDLASTYAAASSTKYLGNEEGLGTSIATTSSSTARTPIDLKADDQMFALKARLDIKVLQAFTGSSGAATLSVMTCGPAAADTTGNTPDTSNAYEVMAIPLTTAHSPVASSMPWFEITMPSNLKRWVFLKIVVSANAFTTGKILVNFNPNL